ncbi:efflux ABC transporter, permease protein [Verrucomicrobiia bacterium DG1235]|nr:efflux ABC transporter, permease protein [Verrucomicrobiae bacterium DG1235]
MRRLRELYLQIRAHFRSSDIADEIDAEIEQHLEFMIEDYIAEGHSPAAARRLALKKFGNIDAHKERARDSWGTRRVFDSIRDFKFGLRLCLRFPSSSIMAVLVLSIGIALSTMMFTISYRILNTSAGADLDDSQLFIEWETGREEGQLINSLDLKVFRQDSDALENFIGIQNTNFWFNLPGKKDEGTLYVGVFVSPSFFSLSDTPPLRGHLFSDTSFSNSALPQAVISETIWETFFERDENTIGATVFLNDQECQIVAIMPSDFSFPRNQRIWVATDWSEYDGQPRSLAPNLGLVASLKKDRSINHARAEFTTIASNLEIQFPDTNRDKTQLRITPYREKFVDADSLWMVSLIMIGSLPVLLLACVNTFNIIMARTATRTHELAVRSSLGARRSHIIWQVVVDGLTLASIGTILGVLLAVWGIEIATGILQNINTPGLHMREFRIDQRVILFSIGAAILAGLTSSIIPAWRASSIDAYAIMKDDARSSNSIYIGWLSKVAVLAQVAFSGVLIFMSFMFFMPTQFFETIEMPFEEDTILAVRMELATDSQFDSSTAADQLYTQLTRRLTAEPGVETLAITSAAFGMVGDVMTFEFEGETNDTQLSSDFTQITSITPNYLEAFGEEIVEGRMISAFDTADTTPVCVVNTNFVNTHCQHLNPIGMRLRLSPEDDNANWITIVGVIPSLKPDDLGPSGKDVDRSFSEILVPISQRPTWSPTLLLKAEDAAHPRYRQAMRQAMQELAPRVQTSTPLTLGELIDALSRLFNGLSLAAQIFGGAILCMSLVGLYSIITFATTQRQKEFGIRIAVGANSWNIAKSVLKPWTLTIGGGLGLAAVCSVIIISSFIAYGTMGNSSSKDWKSIVLPALVTLSTISFASLLAMAIPTWRATKTDPIKAIRFD